MVSWHYLTLATAIQSLSNVELERNGICALPHRAHPQINTRNMTEKNLDQVISPVYISCYKKFDNLSRVLELSVFNANAEE